MDLRTYLNQRNRASELAREIGAHMPDVSDWKLGNRKVPLEYCYPIERATNGAVTRKDLRPNDWHEIWPELAEKEKEDGF